MLNVIVGLLTFILVLDAIALIFLVLIQLPKKEAGAGLAFGGAATDALFGAGSGTVLTKITKYAAGIFFVIAIILAAIQSRRTTTDFERRLQSGGANPLPASTVPAAPKTGTPAPAAPTLPLLSTNAPAQPQAEAAATPATTNAPAPPQ